MSHIETVYIVTDPQPTVEESVKQLAQRLDKNLKDLVTVFQEAGDQLWNAEPASHTVTPVPVVERRPTGIIGREKVQVTHYIASALVMVSFQKRID
ncbi:hypothetical protein [Paenarthrobacter ureafaciens]|uniref:hypothetical protein n=1 Tax=Paenarthrobacter ureafaciens TaxID=37931 RepID=UPI002271F527|nr:hypothetical protein [Paenarthrobacter ureafaciens]MCY0975597.1 hypothetical protein [Paenarthrobacter ureafaciens]